MKPYRFLQLYAMVGALHLASDFLDLETSRMITKMALMPILAIYAYQKIGFGIKNLLLALFFAWLGDTFLFFAKANELFFLSGLGSFLVMQLLYTASFWRNNGQWIWNTRNKIIVLFCISYLIGMLWILLPELPSGLQIQVAIYAIVIAGMCANTAAQQQRMGDNWRFLGLGALLFMVSDTCIAMSKFLPNLSITALLDTAVMPTYIVAQGLIVWMMCSSD
jgi:uncharacterized membrane protein YhhN